MEPRYDYPGCCRECGFIEGWDGQGPLDGEGFCQKCRGADEAWEGHYGDEAGGEACEDLLSLLLSHGRSP